jgi:hypothetical protein
MTEPIFSLGRCVATAGVAHWASETPVRDEWIRTQLARHSAGDWGDLDEHDQALNNAALKTGDRFLSAYLVPDSIDDGPPDSRLYVITEATAGDPTTREITTALWPREY